MKLDPQSKIPKYLQIRKWMIGMISRGKISVGSKIPTEEEIAKKFEVNRMTVRQALEELVLEKMIVRKRGEGSILVSARPQGYVYELDNISSFNDDMETRGIQPIHNVLKVEVLEADKVLANQLELNGESQVIHILSVKNVGNEPVLIEKSHLAYQEFSPLLNMPIKGSFYHILVEKFQVTLHHATQIFSAVSPPPEVMELFSMKDPFPCMMLESIVYDPQDIPIEVLHSYYRGDRYRFKAFSGEYLFDSSR